MENLISVFIYAFAAVFVIVNPLSGLFTFMSMTSSYPHKAKMLYSKKSILLAMGMALFFAVAGSLVLSLFNIDIDALRIAGGIILISVGFRMMTAKVNRLSHPLKFQKRTTRISGYSRLQFRFYADREQYQP